MKKSQGTPSVTLATEEMGALWRAAVGATLHGPKCACAGFGLLRRSQAELERDIVEFLIAKYEEKQKVTIVHLFERWLDERTPGWNSRGTNQTGLARVGPAAVRRDENLLQWIDRNAPLVAVSEGDLREIVVEIRTLLESMAMPTEGFVCG